MRRKRSRRKAMMNLPAIDTNKWLSEHPEYLISCPNQPGNLKLSADSCMNRYIKANEPRWSNIGAEPFPIFVFKMNLIACRECDIGAKLAASRPPEELAA